MFKNFLKTTVRNLWKNKLYSAIKIGGLGISLATCLLVGLYVHHELTYDAFHEKADRIVRTTMEYRFSGEVEQTENTGNKMGPSFKNDFPEVEDAVRVISYDLAVRYEDRFFEETDIYFADPSFFSIFSFPFIQGNPETSLLGPNEVVVTAKMATKYFGEENPVGWQIQIGSREYLIQGVMADPPAKSQLKPHFIASFASLRDASPERSTWWNANYATYLLLANANAIHTLQEKIPDYMRSKEAEHGAVGEDYLTFMIEPIRDVRLHSSIPGNFVPNGDIRYIYILSFAALIVLLIASITYVNLTTATSAARAVEIGVSKVIGATRSHLFKQYIGEAMFATGLALILGMVITTTTLPVVANLLQRELTIEPLMQYTVIGGVIIFSLLISLLAGIYPASVLSNYQPVKVLKGTYRLSKSGNWLRKSLIVTQFSVSVFLMICAGILFSQLQFIQNRTLGYEKDQVLVLPADGQIVNDIETIRAELIKNANVHSVSLAYETPVYIQGGYDIAKSVSGVNSKPVTALPADEEFIETVGLKLVAGSSFQKRHVDATRPGMTNTDSIAVRPVLINETQAASFEWTPKEAVNQLVEFNGGPARILGVVEDFHFASLHTPIENLVIFPSYYGREVLVRMDMQNVNQTVGFMESTWERVVSHRPFSFHFMSDEVHELYQSESLIAKLIWAITVIAVFMTVIGLFGLSAIMAQHRTKEIGIRKVLGASVMSIIGLLSSDLVKLAVLAIGVAAPFAFILMQGWLEGFAYRIVMPASVFVGAGLLAFLIALLTVCSQSLKLVLANPVDSLRHE